MSRSARLPSVHRADHRWRDDPAASACSSLPQGAGHDQHQGRRPINPVDFLDRLLRYTTRL